jgi:hypothetical protein
VLLPAWAVPGEDCCADPVEAVSPPTGVVPGAGCAAGVEAGVVVPVDCAPSTPASVNTNAASDPALKPFQTLLLFQAVFIDPTSRTARRTRRFALLYRR